MKFLFNFLRAYIAIIFFCVAFIGLIKIYDFNFNVMPKYVKYILETNNFNFSDLTESMIYTLISFHFIAPYVYAMVRIVAFILLYKNKF